MEVPYLAAQFYMDHLPHKYGILADFQYFWSQLLTVGDLQLKSVDEKFTW